MLSSSAVPLTLILIGKAKVVAPIKVIGSGVAFCMEGMAIAPTSTKGID